MRRSTIGFAATLGLLFVAQATLLASVHTWSGAPIVGERADFLPSGSAEFVISDSILTITLENDSPGWILTIGEVLTGLTWDITDPSVTLGPLTAMIPNDSILVGVYATDDKDMSSEWAFRDDLSAGSSAAGPLGSFGVGAMGDVNLGVDSFGPKDRFDTVADIFDHDPPPGSLNGIEPGLVGPKVDLESDGFTSQGPVVQGVGSTAPGQTIFTFDIVSGILTDNEITNVQPLFGTDGATLAPEPSTLVIWLLLGALSVIVGCWRRHKEAAT